MLVEGAHYVPELGESQPQLSHRGRNKNCRKVAGDVLKRIFFNENCCIFIQISLRFVHNGLSDNKPALFHQMTRYRTGDNSAKPIAEPMVTQFTDASMCENAPNVLL